MRFQIIPQEELSRILNDTREDNELTEEIHAKVTEIQSTCSTQQNIEDQRQEFVSKIEFNFFLFKCSPFYSFLKGNVVDTLKSVSEGVHLIDTTLEKHSLLIGQQQQSLDDALPKLDTVSESVQLINSTLEQQGQEIVSLTFDKEFVI